MMDLDLTSESATEAAAAPDSLRRYLSEIGRYPLLTRSEEAVLARRAEAGDPVAKRRLVESNLRLVVAIAKTFPTGALDLLDLVQEGTIGLMRAAERYDWRRGAKFSTYASWWIRAAIMDALSATSHPIRLPDSVRTRIGDVKSAEQRLTACLGRRPSLAEIADELGLRPAQVVEARGAGQSMCSLDEPLSADGELRHADLLADEHAADPLQGLLDEADEGELGRRLRSLPARSRRVVELRYGVGGGAPRTADSVAAELGLARERVRQIELDALRRLGAVEPRAVPRAA